MLGSGLLISPVLNPGQTKVNAYFPDSRWYDFRSVRVKNLYLL